MYIYMYIYLWHSSSLVWISLYHNTLQDFHRDYLGISVSPSITQGDVVSKSLDERIGISGLVTAGGLLLLLSIVFVSLIEVESSVSLLDNHPFFVHIVICSLQGSNLWQIL